MHTSLTLLQDLPLYKDEKPYYFIESLQGIPEAKMTNCRFETRESVPLIDVRTLANKPSLESHGWEYLNHTSKVSLEPARYIGEEHDQNTVGEYVEECIGIAQARYPASKIICFDWRVRHSNATRKDVNTEDRAKSRRSVQTPAKVIHVDYSARGGYKRLVTHLTVDEYELVNQDKLRPIFVNIWRPLKPVTSSPIFFGDPNTRLAEDLIEVDKVSADSVEFGCRLKNTPRPNGPTQQYYWISQQKPEEPVMFISWNTRNNGDFAAYPPHGAAMAITDEDGQSRRVSIEVRMMVLTPNEEV